MGESITFDNEDIDGLILPHNDASVIILRILGTDAKRVLTDPDSSVNNIQL